jgi:uncharacterized phage protein (TIGR01671 family)
MRELKYRVYIPEFSKYVYFGLNNFDHSDRYLDNPEHPVQQYTGMKDKYGKDIYEGDIVINTTSKEEYCSPAVIVWGKYEFVGFALAYKRNKLEDYHAPLIHKINGVDLVEEFNLSKIGIYQIVGNVSENPELLK